ncbi:MAG: hypothetical protein LBD38_01575, partial [Streptococcaceae bacterium]|nr:hypothetical protein [Streptococcaceae bacterium]
MPRNKLNLHLLSSNREGNRHRLFFLIFTILFGIGLFLFFQSKFTVECLDEFEQTEAYDFFSKLDAEASHEDKFIHSKIEECLFFLQYRFVKENRKGNFPFEDDGENLWNSLHNRREKSYTLREIIQQKEKDFYLTPTSVKEFSSLFEGRLSERSLVFHLPTNDGTLNVKSRYGWKKIHSKLEHFDSILITCEANTPILLPFFADKIIEKGKELHIQTEKTRVMYCGGRWNGKSSGGVGEVIGTTTGNELEISVER